MEKTKKFLSSRVNNSDEICRKLEKYRESILEKNNSINLTNITELDEFEEKHYIDSLLVMDYIEIKNANKIMDLGTGAGFPGIPLALVYPGKRFILVDSLKKRLKIIEELCNELNIKNVELVHGRAEELGRKKELRENMDICLSRAVSNMATLMEYSLPFVKKGGWAIAYKGPGVKDEIREGEKAIKILGGVLDRIEIPREQSMKHLLVFVNKIKETPKKYPRKPGMPQREPIK